MSHVLALKVQYPTGIERAYEGVLISLVNDVYGIIFENIFNRSSLTREYLKVSRVDDFNDDLRGRVNVSEVMIALKLKDFIKKIISTYERLNRFNQKAVFESLKNIPDTHKQISMGLSAKLGDKRAMWVSRNVSLIKSIGSNSLREVEQVVYSAVRRGVAHTELLKELTKRFTISKKRARVIARDQINKLNGDLTRARHLDLGILFYKWVTSKDERVRKSHGVLSDKICNYKDVDIYKNNIEEKVWSGRSSIDAILSHPGQDILCRCTSVAVIPF